MSRKCAARILVASSLLLLGCGPLLGLDDPPAPRDSGGSEEAVTDALACPAPLTDLLSNAAKSARIASQSNLVRACIYAATHGASTTFASTTVEPYAACTLDPSAADSADRRYDAVIAYLRTLTDFPVPCTSHPPIHVTAETYEMASWLAGDHGSDPSVLPRVAGMLAHLAIDDRGYEHGGDTSGHAAYLACAPSVMESAWSSARSMPFIVESCIEQTLHDSASVESYGCTPLTCGASSLALAENAKGPVATAPDCVCVEDPKVFGPPLAMFYDGSTGSTSIARLGEDSSLSILATSKLGASRIVGALPWNLRVFLESKTGNTELLRVDALGGFTSVPLAGMMGFSAGWSSVFAMPSERAFEYQASGLAASSKLNPTGFTPTSASFTVPANVRLATAPSFNTVFLLDAFGTAETGRVSILDGTYSKLHTSEGFYDGWSLLASAGDGYVLLYRRDNGEVVVGQIAVDGKYFERSRSSIAKEWDRLATTFDGRFVFYASTGGKVEVYRLRPNGALVLEHAQTGLPFATDVVVNR